MAFINTKVNEYGDLITINNPNQTIQNIQNVSFDSSNFRLQGIEVRNFDRNSVTENSFAQKTALSFGSTTFTPTANPLGGFGGSFRLIGPYNMASNETVLLECSFGFETDGTGLTTGSQPGKHPRYVFSLGFADNVNGNNVQQINGTIRAYRSNTTGVRRVAGSCTIVHAFKFVDSTPKFFYFLMEDTQHPTTQTNIGAITLTIYSMQFFGRVYKK